MQQQLTIKQAADLIGAHDTTVRQWIARGVLRAHYFGPRLIRIDPADLQAMRAQVNPITFEHENSEVR